MRQGDGWRGWPEHAPFDAIMVTAAPEEVPPDLIEQLAVGGRLVIPVGRHEQQLLLLRKTPEGIAREVLFGVRFVPMRGEAEKDEVIAALARRREPGVRHAARCARLRAPEEERHGRVAASRLRRKTRAG